MEHDPADPAVHADPDPSTGSCVTSTRWKPGRFSCAVEVFPHASDVFLRGLLAASAHGSTSRDEAAWRLSTLRPPA
jgi:hypothetical protein